jgi:hypothetical protein
MKRYTFRFGDPTSADLEWLSQQMHDGNVKATLAELVRNERRRLEGDLPSAVPMAAQTTQEPVSEAVKNVKVKKVMEVVPEPPERPVEPVKTKVLMEELRAIAAAPVETPTAASLPAWEDLDVPEPLEEVHPEAIEETPEHLKQPPKRFKVFDPKNPLGSKPRYSEDQAGSILWSKEKKEYEDSLKVNLTGARQA